MRYKGRVLVACEFSGVVRRAFAIRGFRTISVDIRETEMHPRSTLETHIQSDILEFLEVRAHEFDLMIAHPPCTYLCNSGVRWLHERPDRWPKMYEAAWFMRSLLGQPKIPHVAVENPVMHGYAKQIISKQPDFSIQPYEFGVPHSKRTCFWTRNLPKLEPTDVLDRDGSWDNQTPAGNEGRSSSATDDRQRTYKPVAMAMANQWGPVIE